MPPRLSLLWYDLNYCVSWLAYTLLWGLRWEGVRNLPPKGPVLLLANHQSFLDPIGIGVATSNRRLYFLARKTLFVGLLGDYLRSVRVVPVDQEGIAKEGLKTILQKLSEGEAVLVFPEGERCPQGQMLPFKPGIHLLIKRLSVPIVPIGIAGAYEAFPRHEKFPHFSPLFLPPRKRGPMAISIGKPIPSERFKDVPREKVLQELYDVIYAQWQQAEKLRRRPG